MQYHFAGANVVQHLQLASITSQQHVDSVAPPSSRLIAGPRWWNKTLE